MTNSNGDKPNILAVTTFWLSFVGILLGLSSGLSYIFLSYWMIIPIVLIGVGLIFFKEKLPELKESFTVSNDKKNLAIATYSIIMLGIFPIFFHGLEVELKKIEIKKISTENIKSVEAMISDYKSKKITFISGKKRKLSSLINEKNEPKIIELAKEVGIPGKDAREGWENKESFTKKYKRKLENIFISIDSLISKHELLKSNSDKNINSFFIIKLPELDREIKENASKIHEKIKPHFSEIAEPVFIDNYPFKKPLKSFKRAETIEVLGIILLYLLFNVAILWEFIIGESTGLNKPTPPQKRK